MPVPGSSGIARRHFGTICRSLRSSPSSFAAIVVAPRTFLAEYIRNLVGGLLNCLIVRNVVGGARWDIDAVAVGDLRTMRMGNGPSFAAIVVAANADLPFDFPALNFPCNDYPPP